MATAQLWKPSFFNINIERNGKRMVFNGASAQMIELSGVQKNIFEDCLAEIETTGYCSDEAMLQCLISFGFVVPKSEDEYENERRRFLTTKADKEVLRITIAPTMACNLQCSYCFQKNVSHRNYMKSDIQRGVIELVRRKVEGSKLLVVQWFGGEPLLAYDQILSMTEAFKHICDELGVKYYSEILTNGTLLTEQIIRSFRQISLRAIQISLDGNPDTYARRKNIPIDRAIAYHRFLVEHIQSIVDVTGSVSVRINVDRDNPEAGENVVRMFKEYGCVDPRIDFRLGFINMSRGMLDCIPHDCFSPREFSEVEMNFRHFLAKEGYRVYGEPERRYHPCSAPLENSYTIAPDGNIGKCVPSIGMKESVFSRIYAEDIDRTLKELGSVNVPYREFDPFVSEACSGCKLLPLCLGSCPRMHEPGKSVTACLKEGLIDMLKFYYDNPD